MPESLQILSQVAPLSGASNNGTVYAVPSGSGVVLSTIVICNTLGTAQSWNLNVAKAGIAFATNQNLFVNQPLSAYQTTTMTLGLTASGSDVFRGYSSASGAVTYNLFGDVQT